MVINLVSITFMKTVWPSFLTEKNEQYEYLTSLHQRKQSELEMKLKDMSEDQQRMQVGTKVLFIFLLLIQRN